MPNVIERHQDYIITCPAIANGATARNVEIRLDTDAPFCVRQVGGYVRDGVGAVIPLTGGFLQWADPDERYLQSEPASIVADTVVSGQNALYSPVYQQRVFPEGSVLMFNLRNNSGSNWGQPKVIFRGTKLFYEGDIWSPSYPDCFQSIPYSQSLTITAPTTTAPLTDQAFQVGNDADLALRGALCAETTDALGTDVEFRLADYYGKRYSNDYINWRWLFSTTAQRPGLFYPELYIPSKEQFFYDVRQGTPGAAAVFNLSLMGAKVFAKRAA